MRTGLDHDRPRRGELRPRYAAPVVGLVLAALLAPADLAVAQQDASFGRLFHSPEERRQLDQPAAPAATEPSPVTSDPRRLDGIVRRSDGRSTLWIDGHAAGDDTATASSDARAATIVLPDGERLRVLVGESYAPDGVRR